MATAKASKPYHYIRVSRNMFHDLMVWKLLLENFNGVSYILDKDWVSNVDLQLFTDSAGEGSTPLTCQNGCGVFFMGKLCYLQWPKKWHNSDILRDMTFLEMLPIALEICLWHKE
jgi:hypothetical protein